MLLPFRLRVTLCALSIGVLSGCGGGGDYTDDEARAASVPPANQIYVLGGTTEAMPQAYEFTFANGSEIETLGSAKVGFITMFSAAVELKVGHLQGNKQKFFVVAEVPGSQTIYECISAAWTSAEKDAMLLEFNSIPATCSADITFNGATDQFSMVRAQIPSPSGQTLTLNVNTRLLPIVFPA